MKADRISVFAHCLALAACAFLFSLSAPSAGAAGFGYTNADLVAGFRQVGAASDLVVDLGPAAYYETLAPRTVLVVTNVTAAQVNGTFSSLNNVYWSVCGSMHGNTNYPQYPLQTVWATSPRQSLKTAGLVWVRKGQFTQGPSSSQIDAIGSGAVTYASNQPVGANNTTTGIVISSTDQYAYTTLMDTVGDLGGTFQGDVENLTATNFVTAGLASRSVLYELMPGSGATLNTPGKVVGFFDLEPNGTLIFTAGVPPEQTRIISMTSSVSGVSLGFPTITGVSYRLRYVDPSQITTSVGTWSTSGTFIVGDGNVDSLVDGSPTAARVYVVEAFY